MAQPVKLYLCSASADTKAVLALEKRLMPLKRSNLLQIWHKGKLLPGDTEAQKIAIQLDQAQVIVMLISSDFFTSEHYESAEMTRVLHILQEAKVRIIPVILKDCLWQETELGGLQPLPEGGKPVGSEDKAWQNVVIGIQKIAIYLQAEQKQEEQPASPIARSKARTSTHTSSLDGAALTVESPHALQPSRIPGPSHPNAPPKPDLLSGIELKIPEMGKYFLSRQDREYLINIVDTTVNSIPVVDGVKNLLRDKLPLAQINRINYRNGSRNIAEEIIGSLEPRGALNPPYYHALGAFLKDLIEDDLVSYDAAAHIVALLFGYTLVKDRKQIGKLSAQFQVPSPLLTEELLINHPYSLASFSKNIKTTNLQERFESLYNRRRYLLNVKFLSEGAKAARSVCRIDFDKRGEGTGFLVAPDLILTNYHVMIPPGYKGDPNIRARKCEIKFGVIEGVSAGTRFTLNTNKWLIEQSKPEDLDFMLLKLNRPVIANDQVWPLSLESNPIQSDEFVNIIQHPNGGSMEVSLRFNQVVAVEDNRIYYLADTEEGSSGSPVFNDSWELVALHHSGGKLDGSGNLTVAANIGVPMNAIREKIAVYLNK